MIILESMFVETVLRAAAIGIARADDGEILYAIPLLEAMFGYQTRGALVNGIHVDALVPHEAGDKHILRCAADAANCRTNPLGLGIKAIGLRADGSTFPVSVSVYSEVISGIVCVVFCVQSREHIPTSEKAAEGLKD